MDFVVRNRIIMSYTLNGHNFMYRRVLLYVVSFLACALPIVAYAQSNKTQELFPHPNGLAIFQKGGTQAPAKLYGTEEQANWVITQWDIPKELPPLKDNRTNNEYASVIYNPPGSFTLSQDGTFLPCEKKFPSGRKLADEFDLGIGPLPRAIASTKVARIPLSQLTSVLLSTTFQVNHSNFVAGGCKVTQSNAGAGFVLTNLISKQAFFYQISFASFRDQNGKMEPINLKPNWFFTGNNTQSGKHNQFGYGDRIWSSYGISQALPGNPLDIKINILPKIKERIRSGARFGVDQDLSHWAITGEYYGQAIWGHTQLSTTWKNISLVAQ